MNVYTFDMVSRRSCNASRNLLELARPMAKPLAATTAAGFKRGRILFAGLTLLRA